MAQSNGLMGLPHFRSSRVSMDMFEPAYLNLFTVSIDLPSSLGISDDDKNLLLEGVTKVGGLETTKVPAAGTSQTYKFATRRFANSGPESTTLDISLSFEINIRNSKQGAPDMYTLKILRQWTDLIYDPISGRQGLKVDYVAPSMTVVMHDKIGQPYWQWTCYNVWPTQNLPAPALDYTNKSAIYKIDDFKLACDYWDEVML